MRDYGKVSPQFWTGATGKALKASGPEAVIVSLYLMTCPHSNMIGLYYMPTLYIAHETGLGLEGASKGLLRAEEAGFCTYDEASEYVFVHEMARFQIADELKVGDNRCKGVANELARCPNSLLRQKFFDLHGARFHLPDPPGNNPKPEAPPKPLGSQEQEQEQEQEQDIKHKPDFSDENSGSGDDLEVPADSEGTKPDQPKIPNCPIQEIVDLYHEVLPELPKTQVLTEKRKTQIRQRWRDFPSMRALDRWRAFFEFVRESDFLMGRVDPMPGRKVFVADLEFLTTASKFVKVIEKKYHDPQAA